jgi:hypothetical protein
VIDLIDAERADDTFGLDDQRAVTLASRRAGREIEQGADIEHGQDLSMEIAHATECGGCRGHAGHEAEADDLAHPSKLERIARSTDREDNDVAKLRHVRSISAIPRRLFAIS